MRLSNPARSKEKINPVNILLNVSAKASVAGVVNAFNIEIIFSVKAESEYTSLNVVSIEVR